MKRQRHKYSQYCGRRTDGRKLFLPLLAVLLLVLAAVCWFAVPGMRFSAKALVCAAAVCLLAVILNRWAGDSSVGTAVRRIFLVCLAVFAILFAVAEGVIINMGRGSSASQKADAVIVLGAGVNGRNPSLVLESRINAAADYLQAHPQVSAVVSGGKGSGEIISEAQAIKDGLIARGISSDRLYLEKESTSTAENLQNSKRLLIARGIDPKGKTVALVTSDFHVCRACFLAEKNGIKAAGVPAKTPHWWLSVNYYAREVFALGGTLLQLV